MAKAKSPGFILIRINCSGARAKCAVSEAEGQKKARLSIDDSALSYVPLKIRGTIEGVSIGSGVSVTSQTGSGLDLSGREDRPVVDGLLLDRSWRRPAGHEHDLASHAFLPQQLVSAPSLGEGESLRNQRLDLLLPKKVQQSGQILSK